MFYRRTKGQSTLEYVILTGFVVAALIAMGVYMKRGIQGKLRESTDQVGEQYDPKKTTSNYTTNIRQNQKETVSYGGQVETELIGENYQKKSGKETVGALEDVVK